jgi:hypothetical protein
VDRALPVGLGLDQNTIHFYPKKNKRTDLTCETVGQALLSGLATVQFDVRLISSRSETWRGG